MCSSPRIISAKKALVLLLAVLTAIGCGCAALVHDQSARVAGLMDGYQLAVNQDGTVSVYGAPPDDMDFSGWRDIKSVSVGRLSATGVRNDGTVVVTGSNAYGACNTEGWRDIRMAEATFFAAYGLRNDGTVIATEPADNTIDWAYEIRDAVEGWRDIVCIDCSDFGVVGLKKDGTVVTAIPVFSEFAEKTSRWTDVVAISMSFNSIVGITKSGEPLFAMGDISQIGQEGYTLPYKEMVGAVKICVGSSFVAGLWPDGTVKVRSTIPRNPYLAPFLEKDAEDMTFEEVMEMMLQPDYDDFTRSQWKEVHQYTIDNMPEDLKAIDQARQVVDINSYEDSLVALTKDGTVLVAGTIDDDEDD
jgi:alpha-tubulin suppressor-like RCC1 family protein